MLQKIDELKEPPIIGEFYLVPCILKESIIQGFDNSNSEWIIKDGELYLPPAIAWNKKETEVYPIINHLHHDKENGQDYKHYHIDYRFVICYEAPFGLPIVKMIDSYNFAPRTRYNLIDENNEYNVEYHKLKCIRQTNLGIGGFVNRSKLHSKCISSKNRCPHRKYDLSQEVPVNGIITCPLHGLKFNSESKQLIE